MRNNGIYTRPSLTRKGRRFCVCKTLMILFGVTITTYVILNSRLQHFYPEPIAIGKVISGNKISQPKCALPNLPLDNPEITKYIEEFPRIECKQPDGQREEDWVVVNGSHAVVTEEARARHKNINCIFSGESLQITARICLKK
ncbi:unnamed protein product [Allacma fusca]|nr:unnamed protein product [Allacma fusca]